MLNVGKEIDMENELSQQLYNDFLKELKNNPLWVTEYNIKARQYPMSYDYLIDLIEKVKGLEKQLFETECNYSMHQDYCEEHHMEKK